MIHLDKANPRFDLAMEVMVCLPRYPATVPMSLLANDLGLDGQQAVLDAIRRLRDAGFRINTRNLEGRRAVCVSRSGWQRANREGAEYLHAIYGLGHGAENMMDAETSNSSPS